MEQAMREEFEAWHHAEFGYCVPEEEDPLAIGECVKRWRIWQASRAALRVELPPSVTIEEVAEQLGMDEVDVFDITHMVNGAIAACAAFIKQAGIEVK
ncbi:TPA: hypothetical protein L4V44_004538 [Pseudomonas aeruginosa]|nr:hypothetical protein [Pseudomonas aeruginosa]